MNPVVIQLKNVNCFKISIWCCKIKHKEGIQKGT